MEDSIRRTAELCDSLQGYQVLVDVDSGFSGATSHFLQYLREEYAKAPIFTFSLDSPPNLLMLEVHPLILLPASLTLNFFRSAQ